MHITIRLAAALTIIVILVAYVASSHHETDIVRGEAVLAGTAPPSAALPLMKDSLLAAPQAQSPIANGVALKPASNVVSMYRQATNYRTLAHQALSGDNLTAAELAASYYILCSGLPQEWFVGNGSGAGTHPKITEIRSQLMNACGGFRGDLQLVQAALAHSKRLTEKVLGDATEGDSEKLKRFAREGNSESLILAISTMPSTQLAALIGPIQDNPEFQAFNLGSHPFTLSMAFEASVCSKLGCDDRFRFVTHCMADASLCEVPDAALRFEKIATKMGLRGSVDAATWRALRNVTDGALEKLRK